MCSVLGSSEEIAASLRDAFGAFGVSSSRGSSVVVVGYDCASLVSFDVATSELYPDVVSRDKFCFLIGCLNSNGGRRVAAREASAWATAQGKRCFFLEVDLTTGRNIKLLSELIKARVEASALGNGGGAYRVAPPARTSAIVVDDDNDVESPSRSYHRHAHARGVLSPPRDVRSPAKKSADYEELERMFGRSTRPTQLRVHRTGSVDVTNGDSNIHMTRDGKIRVNNGKNKSTPEPANVSRRSPSAVSASKQLRPPRTVLVDVDAEGEPLGTIRVGLEDDVAKLAKSFVEENRLPAGYVTPLTELLRSKVEEFRISVGECYGSPSKRSHASSPGTTAAASPLRSPPVPTPDTKTTPQPRSARRREHRLTASRSDASVPPPPPSRSPQKPIKSRKILRKLTVDAGGGRTATLAVREGDDPDVLLDNFMRVHGVSNTSRLAKDVRRRVVRVLDVESELAASPAPSASRGGRNSRQSLTPAQKELYYRTVGGASAPGSAAAAPPRSTPRSAPRRSVVRTRKNATRSRPLFRLEVEHRGGMGQIDVFRDDDPNELAELFVERFRLPKTKILNLSQTIAHRQRVEVDKRR